MQFLLHALAELNMFRVKVNCNADNSLAIKLNVVNVKFIPKIEIYTNNINKLANWKLTIMVS